MAERESEERPSVRALLSNWRGSDLPIYQRSLVALRNYRRRLGIPPRSCCGHPGEPGC